MHMALEMIDPQKSDAGSDRYLEIIVWIICVLA